MASRSTDGASYNSIELGPTLNFFAKRFVQPVLSRGNDAENHMLVFGVGYRYLARLDQPSENRIELDVTGCHDEKTNPGCRGVRSDCSG